MQGTIDRLVRARGFGFVAGDDSTRYFLHYSSIEDFDDLKEGDRVTFEIGATDKGPRAHHARLLDTTATTDATTVIPSQGEITNGSHIISAPQ